MRNNPFKQFGFGNRAVRKPPAELNQLIIGTSNRMSVDFQKDHHSQYADTFVSVNKRMIFYEGVSKMSRHCLKRRVQIFSVEGMKRRIDGEIQQVSVSYTISAAALSYEFAMQNDNRFLREAFHVNYFANSIKAGRCLASIPCAESNASSVQAIVSSIAVLSAADLWSDGSKAGLKVSVTFPAGISGGTSMVSRRLAGISIVCSMVMA